MSSRNTYLNKSQRPAAISLYQALTNTQQLVAKGEKDVAKLIQIASDHISKFPENKIDYIAIFDSNTLENITQIDHPARMAIAVLLEKTRLIDNMPLIPS